jgi:hypothetical protein
MFCSMVGSTGDNSTFNDETVIASTSLPRTRSYFGIKDNSLTFPTLSGSNFLGVTNRVQTNVDTTIGAAANNINLRENSNPDTRFRIAVDNSVTLAAGAGSTSVLQFGPNTQGTQSGAYALFYGINILYNPSQSIISGSIIGATAATKQTDISITNLRILMASPGVETTFTTGYYTTGFTSNGGSPARPDAVFIYFPLFANKFRIHNLCVERYA